MKTRVKNIKKELLYYRMKRRKGNSAKWNPEE
jgi:ribosomal protein L29